MKNNFFNFICLTTILLFLFSSQVFAQKSFDNQSQIISKHLKVKKAVFSPQERISIEYFNLPGNNNDWITIIEKSKPDNTYGQWFYTQSKSSGEYTFDILPIGDYEIRVYYNWPEGQFNVQDRLLISVLNQDDGNSIRDTQYFRFKKVNDANQVISIEYKNLPGNSQDWITLVEASSPDNVFGQYFYSHGKKNGTHSFSGVPAGTYELRLYFDWPQGKYEVKARETIIVK
ncbi:MAG: hypothetical protein WHW07_06370 [Bacteroidales bacterium]|jgi:hypothetical protein|nr:hypothetical protein [Bacteroidales bacterium]HOL98170.1 hypothetical protein [Bacteroidales bacterium]HOM36528.1 hypothetical protein [Bacteroidales bacterium]HPD23932.1 hypothetical protein [Bacteroidales bacterium]HRS99912.1 hypothetical protein [Bacteroidales bacterium]